MNKRLLKWILIGAFATLLMGAAVSCKDYSSDIDNLQSQITALSGSVDYLQSLINQGKVVTSVAQTSDGTGVTISFSDGSTYTIYNGIDGTNGKDGSNGNDGLTPYIGDNGDWWIGDTDTGVQAQGPQGEQGIQGEQGEKGDKGDKGDTGATGADGADGQTPFIDSEGYWCIGYDYDDEGNATPHRITDASGKPYKAIGSDGKSADVWTIVGGYWYKNDEKYTDEENPDGIKAQATDGNTPYVDDEGYWCIGGERVKDGNGDYVLARGTNGNNGTDGLTPYVDDEGYWCIGYDTDEDGNETPHRLKDSAGNDIPATGTNGSNGEDGKSYVTLPCPDNDGWFNLYVVTKDTDDEGITTYSYEEYQEHFYQYATGTTLTVLVDGNYLYIYNYYTKDEDDNYVLGANPYTIYLGSELTSIAFVPDWLDSETHYPTTDPFVSITSYLSEYGVEDASNEEYAFVEQTTEASIVDPNINLVYRVNPADAYVQNVNYEFVNRNVKVRSSDVPGDGASPLSIISFTDNANGEPYITMKVGLTGDLSTDGYDFTALKVFSGSDKVITSDYIVLKALEDVKPVLVNPADVKFTTDATTKEEVIAPGYYPRTRGFNCVSVPTKFVAPDTVKTLETSKWIKEDIATVLDPNATTPGDTAVVTFDKDNTNGAWNLEFNYNSSLNITENVDLYVAIGSEDAGTLQAVRLADYVDPDSITYEYTYPDAFYIVDADGNGVNQQEYAHLIDNGDGTVKIDVAGDSADSIDKYPVVRVDAYVSGYLVASTYIVFHITAKHLDDATVDLTASWINYRAITGNYVDNYANTVETHYSYTLAQFVALFADNNSLVDIEDINDVETYYVTSTYDFEFYSVNTGSHDQQIGGKNDKLNGIVNNASATENGTDSGINYGSYGVPIHYFYDSSTTDDHTVFYFGVNNVIWTQHTYSDTYVTNVDGNGVSHNYAPYLLTITFNSKDDRFAPNLTLSWPFYVTDYCVEFEITNPYQIPDPTEYLYPCDTAVVTGHYLAADAPAILVKGQMTDTDSDGVDDTWSMTTDVKEHFYDGDDVFQFISRDQTANGTAGVLHNVSDVVFDWLEAYTNVTPTYVDLYTNGASAATITSSGITSVGIASGSALTGEYEVKGMQYFQVLHNGELCPNTYYLVFVNPFRAGTAAALTLADDPGDNTANLANSIVITDEEGTKNVYYYGGSGSSAGYQFTDDFFATYGITSINDITVTSYDIDWTAGSGPYLKTYVNGNTIKLYVDNESTSSTYGTIHWENSGSRLHDTYTIYVNATVSIGGAYTVICPIEVTLN